MDGGAEARGKRGRTTEAGQGLGLGLYRAFLPSLLFKIPCPILGRAFEWEEDASIKGE